MEYKTLTENINIPTLGLGTWLIGGGREADYSSDKESIESIQAAIKFGYTHIDTAEMYGAGHTEELIGKAIQIFNRSDLFITTKVTNKNLEYNNVLEAANKSLERLQTEYIDLYLIHAPNPDIPIQETMKALDKLVDRGIVKHIGVSNFQVHHIEEAQKYTKHKIVANQIEYSLATRNNGRYADNVDMERKTIPYCQKHNILIMAERPIERGLLLQSSVLDTLAKKYKKTKAQIAINWLISKNGIVTMPKMSSIDHMKENLGALGWQLDASDTQLLDKIDLSELSA